VTITRTNRLGLVYTITPLEGWESIACVVEMRGGKKMRFNASVGDMSQGWYDWMNGALIQVAFPFLLASEREFIMTGLTDKEWDEMFTEKETDNG